MDLPDYTKAGRVKELLRDLEKRGAAITTPCTQVTTLMIGEMYGPAGTLLEACSKVPKMAKVMASRETCLNDFELVGGMRVSEATGGGDGHGLLANLVCIQQVEKGPDRV